MQHALLGVCVICIYGDWVCASNVYTKTQSHVRGCAPYMFAASETLSLYRYIHTHTYIPIYSHIYMFIHIYIYINIYTYTHIYRYAYICINININFLRALHGMQLVPHTLSLPRPPTISLFLTCIYSVIVCKYNTHTRPPVFECVHCM